MSHHFVTYFDVKYAARGIAMVESLLLHSPDAAVTILVLDPTVDRIVADWFADRVSRVTSAVLCAHEPRLDALRHRRNAWEFYSTQKPVLVEWALSQVQPNTPVAYIDADVFFYAGTGSIFAELEAGSIAISLHRFNAETQNLAMYGVFNAGFGIWRNDPNGRECVRQWKEDCLSWCFERVDGDRFMNQGFLSTWPARFSHVVVLRHAGQNLAPWNVGSHRLERGPDGVQVDGFPLVFFHFSCLSLSPDGRWQTIYTFDAMRNPIVLEDIYRPYTEALGRIRDRLRRDFRVGGTESVRSMEPGIPVLDLESGTVATAANPDQPAS